MIPAHVRLGLGLALGVVVLDQLSKWWIVNEVRPPVGGLEVTPFFNLVLSLNSGVSFGLFSTQSPMGRWIFAAVALTICAVLAVWMWRSRGRLLATAFGLVIGGALGNVADRLHTGAVIDFLDFHLAGVHFWAFNVADTGITCGAAVLIWESVFGADDESEPVEK